MAELTPSDPNPEPDPNRRPDPDPGRGVDDALATAIVSALPGGWTRRRDTDVGYEGHLETYLTGPAGESVLVTVTADRVHAETFAPAHLISQAWPMLRLRISAARSKPPAQLAAEIQRRLLARYQPLLRAAETAQHAHDQALARTEALLDEVAVLLAPVGPVQRCVVPVPTLRAGHEGPVQVEVRVPGPQSPVQVQVQVRPGLVPVLARSLAVLATSPGVRAVLDHVVSAALDAYLDTAHGPTDDNTDLADELAPVAVTALVAAGYLRAPDRALGDGGVRDGGARS